MSQCGAKHTLWRTFLRSRLIFVQETEHWLFKRYAFRVERIVLLYFIHRLVSQEQTKLRHQMMDKIQKHNSFNTNTPSSESYKNYLRL
jgi:hypothetical protein